MELLKTVGFYIDEIREALRETSDDSNLEDLTIYSQLLKIRSLLIDREMTKRKELDDTFVQTICISLCQSTYAECCDIAPNIGDTILKSKNPFPEFISNKVLRPISVTTIDGRQVIDHIKFTSNKWNQYFDSGYDQPSYDIVTFNDRKSLVIDGDLTLPAVLVTGTFYDPSGAQLISSCSNGCSSSTDCSDWKDVIFPISAKLQSPLYDMTIERLLKINQVQVEDESNDGESSKTEI